MTKYNIKFFCQITFVINFLILITLPAYSQEMGELLRFGGKPNLDFKITQPILQKSTDGVLYESPTSAASDQSFNRVLFNGMLTDSNLVLQIRFENRDGEWSSWQNVKMKIFKNGRFWARYDLEQDINQIVQYRLLNRGILTPARVEIYAVEALDTKSESKESLDLQPPPRVRFAQVDTIARPPIVTREEWGANPPIGSYVPHTPFRFAQHHTAGRRVSTLQEGIAEQKFIQDFHQNGRGWQDIGYHFTIDDSGRIYEGVPVDFRGTHVGGNNTGNIGISYFGNFEISGEFPTQTALQSLVQIWSWLSFAYGVNPDSLFGHRDYNATACPGSNLYSELPDLRNGIRKQLGFGAPYVSNPKPQPFLEEISPNAVIFFFIRDDEEGVDLNSIVVKVNEDVVAPSISGNSNQYQVAYQPSTPFASAQNVMVDIEAADLANPPNLLNYSYRFKIEVEALHAEVQTATSMRNAELEILGDWTNDFEDVTLPELTAGQRLLATDGDGSHIARIFPNIPETGDYQVYMAVDNTFLGESARYQFGNPDGVTHPHFAEYNNVFFRKWGKLSPTPVHFEAGTQNGYIELSGLPDLPTRLVLDALRLEKVDRLDLPTAPTLKWARRNEISNDIEIAWYPTLEGDIAGYRLFMSEDGRTWDEPLVDEQTLGPETDAFILNYDGDSPTVYFQVIAVDTNKIETEDEQPQPLLSDPTDIYGVGLNGGAKILIVDNFDRLASWRLPYHPFVRSHGDALAANKYGFDSCTETAVQNGEINLNDYDAVVYFCGDDSRDDESLAAADQFRLLDYLENGGKLFISGSEIGYDFDATTTTEKQRYQNLLKATYLGDISGSNHVLGAGSTVFEGLDFFYGTMNTEDTYIEDFPDYILPAGGSEVALSYDNLRIAGIQFTGAYGNSNETAQLVYLAFTFETIVTPEDRADLMGRVMTYFGLPTNVAENSPGLPERFELGANYPNPFKLNSSDAARGTIINFALPRDEQVKIVVYNILGQQIAMLTNAPWTAGRHQVSWNGRTDNGQPAASGVYFYALHAGDFQLTRKLLLIR